jgi:hypothetical protein
MGAVDTTYTFTATDTITSAKMNNIIDQTTITSDAIFGTTLEVVTSGKLKVRSQGITSNELATNSVATTSIADANVTPAKLSNSDFGDFTVASGIATLDNNVVTAAKLNGAQTGAAPIYGARAWVLFDGITGGTATIKKSGNILSVVRNYKGSYTVTFATNMEDADYAVVWGGTTNGLSGVTYANTPDIISKTPSSFIIAFRGTYPAGSEDQIVNLVIFR